jgi:hypothetical protein
MKHARKPEPASPADISSELYYRLGTKSMKDLETVFLRGTMPDLDTMVGWQFRGMNTPKWAKLAGIKKFIKGFELRGNDVFGYNCPVVQNDVRESWFGKPDADDPKRFGFYKVAPVDPTARDNEYLHSVLLDYGKGGNGRFDPTAGLRDYLVRVDEDNDDLFLGKAYYAVGPLRIATNFFLLERFRKVD